LREKVPEADEGSRMLQCSGYTSAMSLLFRDAAGPSLAPGGSVVCVGAFDGVHLGHRALLGRVVARARARGLAACAISFEPIPREFFARGDPVPRLASVREKIERIDEAGIDRLLLLRSPRWKPRISSSACCANAAARVRSGSVRIFDSGMRGAATLRC
jgi:riboflavin kinase/FMN adenylyltransferase